MLCTFCELFVFHLATPFSTGGIRISSPESCSKGVSIVDAPTFTGLVGSGQGLGIPRGVGVALQPLGRAGNLVAEITPSEN